MELYNSEVMPLSNDPVKRQIQEKMVRGEQLSAMEVVKLGNRDRVIKKIGDYECKPNCCYRAISEEAFEIYKQYGYIIDERKQEYIADVNNQGVDWYLGGACPGKAYGCIIIECPAYKKYFVPAHDNGLGMANDISVRHMKSSPQNHPVPLNMITNVFDYRKVLEEQKQKFNEVRQIENNRINIERQEKVTLVLQSNSLNKKVM